MLTKVFIVAVALVSAFVFPRQIGAWLCAHAAKIGRYIRICRRVRAAWRTDV
jgi:hypothetical protein